MVGVAVKAWGVCVGSLGVVVRSAVTVGGIGVAAAVGVGGWIVAAGGKDVAVMKESCRQLLDARARKTTRNNETSFFTTTSRSHLNHKAWAKSHGNTNS